MAKQKLVRSRRMLTALATTAILLAAALDGSSAMSPTDSAIALDGGAVSSAPFGLALAILSDDARTRLGLSRGTQGVLVMRVAPDSRAAKSGLRSGDVIVKLGAQAVATPAELTAKLDAAKAAKQQAVPLLVMRDRTIYYVALDLGAA